MESETSSIALLLAMGAVVVGLMQYSRNLIESFGKSKEKYMEENISLKQRVLELTDTNKELLRQRKLMRVRIRLLTEQLKTANLIIRSQNKRYKLLTRRYENAKRKQSDNKRESDEDHKLP